MTGTTVKNADAVLANLAVKVGKNVKGAAPGGFQTVWNNQMDRSGQAGDTPRNTADAAGNDGVGKPTAVSEAAKPGKAPENEPKTVAQKDARTGRDAGETAGAQSESLEPEDLERAMEMLGTAAAEFMQKLADAFGVSPEELQAGMRELGMEPVDLLNPEALGELMLKLGGAEDSLALLTDEALCDSYRGIMNELKQVTEELSEQLDVTPSQLEELMEKAKPQTDAPADVREEAFPKRETVRPDQRPVTAEREAETSAVRQREKTPGPEETAPTEEETAEIGTADPSKKPETSGDGEKQSRHEADGERQSGLHTQFAQQLKPLQPEFAAQETQAFARSVEESAETRDIMRQIMDHMRVRLSEETTNLEMQLHPESLGTLHVQVESKAGVLTASFIAQDEAVKAALESQMTQLQERFEEQGVKVQAIEVMVEPHGFERNLDQGRGQSQGDSEPSRKPRVRRISLDDGTDALQDMDEEDALAARMLEASGGTVDYTA